MASLAREHNDARIISVGARMHPLEEAQSIVEAFLGASFSGDERHRRRIAMIDAYEADRTLPPLP